MKELFDKLEKHLVTHLWDIARDADEKNGFTCSQQVDDIRDCVSSIKKMREILALPGVR